MCVWGGLWSLITPRWILISVWWDTKHQSQSTNALATNHFNEYTLFWPLSELFFVFHITFPLPHYSLSVLALFYIHTTPLNHPLTLLLTVLFSHSSFWILVILLYHYLSSSRVSSRAPLSSLLYITSTVKTRPYPSKLELDCFYKERSQVQSADWKHQNKSRRLQMQSNSPGKITTVVPLPLTPDLAGNYTCTLRLKNGQVVWATVTLRSNGRWFDCVPCQRLVFICSIISLAQEFWQTSCQLGGDNEPWVWIILRCVFHEAFCGVLKPTSGQFICQASCGLQRRKLLTDTICYAFLLQPKRSRVKMSM